ncbi:hypothetical protein HYALB_00009029 [Hymenoscyphus albidus]|uniref:Uncharacterized protein n=1 Tax=Hymenoscyphus albidus TaxID=595503 RepID=A0A9N9LFL5_9HELO|nr:hypothetical protein HYALB_00009029 [Hymenoscyphus albidus]
MFRSLVLSPAVIALLLHKLVAAVPTVTLEKKEHIYPLPVLVEPGDEYYECGEFPGSLAASDPDAYFKYEHDTPLLISCWELDNTGALYLKTVEDECFIEEYFIYYNETLDITYEDVLPRCKPHRPFQAWWGKPGDPTIGGTVDSDLGSCYHCPDQDCASSPVDYLMLHVYCWLNGSTVNGTNQWWRHAHKSKDYEKCYVPAIVFDRLDYNETGSGERCPSWDQPTEEPE